MARNFAGPHAAVRTARPPGMSPHRRSSLLHPAEHQPSLLWAPLDPFSSLLWEPLEFRLPVLRAEAGAPFD